MPFSLPDLPYAHDALEPTIDARTMEIHHGKHHQAYVDNANKALEGTEWASANIDSVLASIAAMPDEIQAAVRNNAGGHANHSLFWEIMSPDGGGEPEGDLKAAIDEVWGDTDSLKQAVNDAGVTARCSTATCHCSASTSGSTPTTSTIRTGARTI